MNDFPKILILGATGYTGNLISQLMMEENIAFHASGRNIEKLDALSFDDHIHVTTIHLDFEKVNWKELIRDFDLIVNCVGPYNFYAQNLVQTCCDLGKTYFDLTGEQEIVYQSYTNQIKRAKETSARIVHSLAFESTLTDLMLSKSIRKLPSNHYSSFHSYYLIQSKQMSPGTRITMKVASQFNNYQVQNGQLVSNFSEKQVNSDPIEPYQSVFVPYPEVLFAYHRIKPTYCSSNYLVAEDDNLTFLSAIQDARFQKNKNTKELINSHDKRNFQGPNSAERIMQTFELHTYLKSSQMCCFQKIEGKDMYGMTANIMFIAIKRFIEERQSGKIDTMPNGVLSPAEYLGKFGENWLENNEYCSVTETKTFNV